MPAVAPVPGSVTPKGTVSVGSAPAGEAITEGQVIYLNGGSVYKADALTAAKAAVVGVAIAPAASADQCYYVGAQNMVLITGGSFTQNEWYVISGTSGVIEQYSDLSSGEYLTWLGYGDSDNNLIWKNIATGTTKP
jgi:hypothetical protein